MHFGEDQDLFVFVGVDDVLNVGEAVVAIDVWIIGKELAVILSLRQLLILYDALFFQVFKSLLIILQNLCTNTQHSLGKAGFMNAIYLHILF